MSAKKVLLLLCISTYLLNQVSCLKCYFCTSYFNELCRTDPKQQAYEIDCSREYQLSQSLIGIRHPPDQCLKIKGTKTIRNKTEEFIERFCVAKIDKDDMIKLDFKSRLHTDVESIYRCTTDLCNSSNNLLSSGLLILISPFFIVTP